MTKQDRSTSNPSKEPATLPRRSSKFGVGKEIGGAVYVHRQYETVFGSVVEEARKHLPPGFEYTVVKFNLANKSVSFIQAVDFDTASEPTVGDIVVVKQDGSCRPLKPLRDPYVYHHKWLFVADDYAGFDVEESKDRSRAWLSLPDVDRPRIGKKSYWEREVVPRLESTE